MLEQAFGEIIKYGSFLGFLLAGVVFIWNVVNKVVDRAAKNKKELLEKEYKDKELLQIKNAELQKEVESQKKRYVQEMIDGVNKNIEKLDKKFSEVHTAYMEISKSHAVSEERYSNILLQVENYFKMTEANVKTLEKTLKNGMLGKHKEIEQIKTKLHHINEDLVLVKQIADGVKAKRDKA